MQNLFPQEIFEIAQTHGETLVRPQVNKILAEKVPSLLELLRLPRKTPLHGCLHAGLWILAGDIDRAHHICQDIQHPYAAAWHAVVHRQEGDFWNSKYWWRQARGIAWGTLGDDVRMLVDKAGAPPDIARWGRSGGYDPAGFVDLVEAHAADATGRDLLVAVQRKEWMALFSQCIAEAS